MTVDISDMLARLDAYEAWAQQRAARGLDMAARPARMRRVSAAVRRIMVTPRSV